MFRKLCRVERRKKLRRVNYATKKLLNENPELREQTEHLKSYFEKKYEYKPPLPYHELIRRPKRDELPKRIVERMQQKREFYDDGF